MASFDNLNNLFKYLDRAVSSALENEVFNTTKGEMQHQIQNIVYDKYKPSDYERSGLLLKTISKSMPTENRLEVKNTRSDVDDLTGEKKDVSRIVEYGRGYTWGYVRDLDREIGPRPFTHETYKSLVTTDKLERAMEKGLNRQGIKTK